MFDKWIHNKVIISAVFVIMNNSLIRNYLEFYTGNKIIINF